jgi:hypothetical protein
MRKIVSVVVTTILAVFIALVIGVLGRAQTRVAPDQLKATIVIVEWQKCIQASCQGLELMRFRMADGTLTKPYILVPTPTYATAENGWNIVPANWQVQPLMQ